MRILVAYSASSSHVQTTLDYLLALKRYSGFEVSYVHVTHNAIMDFDFDGFDVIFHNYCARLCFDGYVSESYREAMKRFRGLKILAVQDEYNRTNVLKTAIKELGFHVVLTCVPQESMDYVYPRYEFPEVEFVTVLTAYVPDDLAADIRQSVIPLLKRPVVVGYRGRNIGGLYGRLAFEKYEIGRRMKEICETRGIKHDIAMDEDSRIYGTAWFDFIGSCRTMLGSETGSNVFDFDGSIERTYKEMAAKKGGNVSYEEFLPIVAQRESEISMGQISARVFECAVMRTAMILFRGRYSGAIEPDIHYIPLEKDLSNIDDVLARTEDVRALEHMTRRAYEDLVASGRFGYRRYIDEICRIIERKCNEFHRQARTASGRQRSANQSFEALSEVPTAHPLGISHFELIRRKSLGIDLEQELIRLKNAFDKAAAAYCCRFESFRTKVESLRQNSTFCSDYKSAMEAYDKAQYFTNKCQDEHTTLIREWTDRRARLFGGAPIEDEAYELQEAPSSTEILEIAIKKINSDIDRLNALNREAIVRAENAIKSIRVHLLLSPGSAYHIKAQMLREVVTATARQLAGRIIRFVIAGTRQALRNAAWLASAHLPWWTKQLILRIPFSRRVIASVLSKGP